MFEDVSWLDFWTLVAALIAIGVSLYTLNFNRKIEHQVSTQTLIHAQYQLCRDLDVLRVENPEVSHVLALPSLPPPKDDSKRSQTEHDPWRVYKELKARVRKMIEEEEKGNSEGARHRLYMKEHATALNVANIYEQTLLQWDLAKEAEDETRSKVLKDLVEYYEKKMLRSPRMRYHWDHGVSDMLDEPTRVRYDQYVRNSYREVDDPDTTSPLEDDGSKDARPVEGTHEEA